MTNDDIRGVAPQVIRTDAAARECVNEWNAWADAVENARGFNEEPTDETS